MNGVPDRRWPSTRNKRLGPSTATRGATIGRWDQIPRTACDVEQSFRAKPEREPDKEPENEAIRKIIADMKKTPRRVRPDMERVDVDGDGREDLVLWQASGKLDFKTDLYIFLRGAGPKVARAADASSALSRIPDSHRFHEKSGRPCMI